MGVGLDQYRAAIGSFSGGRSQKVKDPSKVMCQELVPSGHFR